MSPGVRMDQGLGYGAVKSSGVVSIGAVSETCSDLYSIDLNARLTARCAPLGTKMGTEGAPF